MLRSLYAGVSGMRSFQTKMDVISNNIANVNTTGFKAGSVRFQDMLSQTIANAQGPGNNLGGINPKQIGLGTTVGTIDTNMVGGSPQSSTRDLDFAIEGEGFFIVAGRTGNDYNYTRDGAFYRDADEFLVNSAGQWVLGYTYPNSVYAEPVDLDVNGNASFLPADNEEIQEIKIQDNITVGGTVYELESYTIDGTGKIIGVYSNNGQSTRFLLGQVALASFSNPAGLEKAGNNNYIESNNSGDPSFGLAGDPGKGNIRQGYLEMSNVDLAYEFTEMIVTSRAYQANSRSITTSDEMLQELINLKR